MSAGTSEFFCLICLLVCSCTALEKITAELGQDVILPCKVPNINNITAVEWIRPDLEPEHVLVYRDGLFDSDNQHPSYQNRTKLQDKEMKDGDVSLILKNVKMEDTGPYVCRVSKKENKRKSIINLEVPPPDNPWKTSTIVGLAVGVIILLMSAVLYFQIRKMKKEKQEEIEQRAKSERKLKTMIQNMNKELDEMNSDPTGSDEKNPQEELKKLQDEKQKWMKTVGNLKTELQNMNQELEQMGSIPVEEVNEDSCFIRLQKISSKEKKTQQ